MTAKAKALNGAVGDWAIEAKPDRGSDRCSPSPSPSPGSPGAFGAMRLGGIFKSISGLGLPGPRPDRGGLKSIPGLGLPRDAGALSPDPVRTPEFVTAFAQQAGALEHELAGAGAGAGDAAPQRRPKKSAGRAGPGGDDADNAFRLSIFAMNPVASPAAKPAVPDTPGAQPDAMLPLATYLDYLDEMPSYAAAFDAEAKHAENGDLLVPMTG